MTRLPSRLAFLLTTVLVVGSLPAEAQRNVDLERLRPALDADGFLGFQGTHTPGPGRWNAALTVLWSRDPVVLRGSADLESRVLKHRYTADAAFQVGVGGRLALAVELPVVLYQNVDAARLGDGGSAVASQAFGDPRFVVRYRFFGEDARIERARHEGPGLALLVGATAPVGHDDAFAGEGVASADVQVTGDFHLLGAGAGAMLGFRHRFDTRSFLGVTFRDELSFALGLKAPVPVTHDLLALLELRGVTDAGSPLGDSARTAVEADLGVRLIRANVAVTGAFGAGLSSGVGAPDLRGLLGVAWAPRVRDADGDRVPDERDECPHLAEDYDGFEDHDGCLDPDNDGDLIGDEDDLCPAEAAEEGRDEDEDGCTDPVVDEDGDGAEDSADACPGEPEDGDGFEDEDGCPEPDNDHDGVPDAQDGCAEHAEDRDGFEDEDGCPESDNDGDGLADPADGCPLVGEDADGFADGDGCPDVDNDGDGVDDAADRCPDARETVNGREDGDGCADTGGRALWTATPDEGGATLLRGRLRFGADHAIRDRAIAYVEQLALELRARRPAPCTVALGSAEPARLTVLREALVARGVPAATLTVLHDATVRGVDVVARCGPLPSDAPSDAPAGTPAAP